MKDDRPAKRGNRTDVGDAWHSLAYGLQVQAGWHRHGAVALGRELRHQGIGAHVLENHGCIFGGVMPDIDQRDHR